MVHRGGAIRIALISYQYSDEGMWYVYNGTTPVLSVADEDRARQLSGAIAKDMAAAGPQGGSAFWRDYAQNVLAFVPDGVREGWIVTWNTPYQS